MGLNELEGAAPEPAEVPADARAWVEVDLSALVANYGRIARQLPRGCEAMAVLKADAYGHGAAMVVRALECAGCASACVATLQEAVELRDAGFSGSVLVLGWTPPELVCVAAHHGIALTAADSEHARALAAFADLQGLEVNLHLAVDTGMHRLGTAWNDVGAVADSFGLRGARVRGVFSHLAAADGSSERERRVTAAQIRRFEQLVAELRRRGLSFCAHMTSSYGALRYSEACFDAVRIGIALYGVASDAGEPMPREIGLAPALSLRARVASVRHVPPGEGVGYGLLGAAPTERSIAVVAIGYADGISRAISGSAVVLIAGKRCPVVGRVCMDQLMVDATDVERVLPGDVATLIGRDGKDEIRVEEVAKAAGTISNEVLSRLGRRLPRIVVCSTASC